MIGGVTDASVVLLLALSVALAVLGRVAAVGRLPRNPYVGVRTMTAMTDERTWEAANRAAGPWWLAAGAAGVLGGLVIAPFSPSPGQARIDVGVVVAAMFVLTAVGAVKGDGAARRLLDTRKSAGRERRPPHERGGRREDPPPDDADD